MSSAKLVKQLTAQWITPESFQRYGQVIHASRDGKSYDSTDAQLVLTTVSPLYIMRLHHRGRKFHDYSPRPVYPVFRFSWRQEVDCSCPDNRCASQIREITAFRVILYQIKPGWHAGPYFDDEFVDFYNLELSDTNINHHTYNFGQRDSLELEFVARRLRYCLLFVLMGSP